MNGCVNLETIMLLLLKKSRRIYNADFEFVITMSQEIEKKQGDKILFRSVRIK